MSDIKLFSHVLFEINHDYSGITSAAQGSPSYEIIIQLCVKCLYGKNTLNISTKFSDVAFLPPLRPLVYILSDAIFSFTITMTSQWPRRRLKSPASRLFTQPFIQTQIKENIKAPRHWPLCGEFTGTGEFPAQRASNAENASIWWRHHDTSCRKRIREHEERRQHVKKCGQLIQE